MSLESLTMPWDTYGPEVIFSGSVLVAMIVGTHYYALSKGSGTGEEVWSEKAFYKHVRRSVRFGGITGLIVFCLGWIVRIAVLIRLA